MRHEVIIEIKKTTSLTSARVTDTNVTLGPDFDLEVEHVERSIDLVASNLMDGTVLRDDDFTDNIEDRIKVN